MIGSGKEIRTAKRALAGAVFRFTRQSIADKPSMRSASPAVISAR